MSTLLRRNMAANSKMMNREIALAIRVGVPHLGRVVQGIRDFSITETNWRFLVSPETHDLPPGSLEGWHGDGVIAQCNTVEEERVLAGLNCPVVNISGALKESRFPRVRNDYCELGRIAAAFFREHGFRRFAFYGVSEIWYSEEIKIGYCDAIEHVGFEVETLLSASTIGGVPRWDHGQEELETWLLSMKTPFAVMAAHDPRAAMVIRACEQVGLRVPTDVAVIGVNDDTVTCDTCRPPLSSIRRNGHQVGRQAAAILNQMIHGKEVPRETIVSVGAVTERESTRTLAIDHPALAAAVAFIESGFSQPIGVDQIVEASSRSRRWLEERFRKELDCSPAGFLEKMRVNSLIDHLQDDSTLTPGMLASSGGFSGTRQLNAAFKRVIGMSVKQYCESRL